MIGPSYNTPWKGTMHNDRALIFLALIFMALFSYWTVNQIKSIKDKDQTGGKAFENLPDTSSTFTQREDVPKIDEKSVSASIVWTANDYNKGDITGKTYTVKSGDTLWEIAEGVYGDGSMWTNLLAANSSQVGFLPNGQQALIFPGQILVIP